MGSRLFHKVYYRNGGSEFVACSLGVHAEEILPDEAQRISNLVSQGKATEILVVSAPYEVAKSLPSSATIEFLKRAGRVRLLDAKK